jgi:hypothetical protein
LIVVLIAVSALCSGRFALTAANAVPKSSISTSTRAQGVNDVKPDECDGIVLSGIVTGSGVFSGTGGNDLILAGNGIDLPSGGGGEDCILGGGGADIIDGGAGDDVILGGPGIDTCTGGLGTDTFPNGECEVPIQ